MNRFDNHAWSILHRPANKGRLSWRPLSLRTRRTQRLRLRNRFPWTRFPRHRHSAFNRGRYV